MNDPKTTSEFRVEQIDHVELFVPDRYAAAAWYQRVLGFSVLAEFESWAEVSGGPLMISSDGGSTKLALFQGEPQGARATAGFHRVAFRVGAQAFLAFVHDVASHNLIDHAGRPVTAASVVDHARAHSIYFDDPYGHHLEITTYDCDAVMQALRA